MPSIFFSLTQKEESKWAILSLVSISLLAFHFLTNLVSRGKSKPPKRKNPIINCYHFQRPKNSFFNPSQSPQKIHKICLTGGPCAGKTSTLSFLSEKLSELGFCVLSVPEIPTLLKNSGGLIVREGLSRLNIVKFQICRIKMQMMLEDFFTEVAFLSHKKSIIICDRGVLDTQAYVDDEVWRSILDAESWTKVNLNKRYDAVIHMVSAAVGAESYYTLENNAARFENLDTARLKDQKTSEAWSTHPRFYVISNSVKTFGDKMQMVLDCVLGIIGPVG